MKKKHSLLRQVTTNIIFIALIFLVLLVPFRLLAGYSTMLHEFAHKEAGEKYDLQPGYSPSWKTFIWFNLFPAPADTTYFPREEDRERIRNGTPEMQRDILLAGINSDIVFAKVVLVIDILLIIFGTFFGFLAYKRKSKKLACIAVICAYLLLISAFWLFWAFESFRLNLNQPIGDVQKLIMLAAKTI